MTLSPEREAELIEQNMPRIYRAVDNFTAMCSRRVVHVPYEDFVQEVAIVFLNYIRKCGSEKDLETFPWYDAKQAMSRLVLSYQPLSSPKRSSSFSEAIHAMPHTISYESNVETLSEVDGMSKHWVDDQDTMMDLDIFLDSLPDYADRVIGMRLLGLPSRKIASQLGITESAISQRLKNYCEKYKKFIDKGDQNV